MDAGFLESRAGNVRLLDRSEFPCGWDQATDSRVTGWEVAQWAKGALAYNALLVAWPEVARLAAGASPSSPVQEGML